MIVVGSCLVWERGYACEDGQTEMQNAIPPKKRLPRWNEAARVYYSIMIHVWAPAPKESFGPAIAELECRAGLMPPGAGES